MKKIRLLTSLVGLTGLSMGLVPTIASCSCNSTEYSVEFTSKIKEKEFSNVSGGISYTFKVSDEETAKATKIKITNLKIDGAETATVAGLVKSTYDSAGNIKVVVNTETLMTQWPNAEKVEFNLLFANKTSGKTTTFDGFVLKATETPILVIDLTPTEFSGCPWSVITDRTNWLYNGYISEQQFSKSFYIDSAQTLATDIYSFIGLIRGGAYGLKINQQQHSVRVIDVNHDILTTPTEYRSKAVFTFQLVNVLSDSKGNALCHEWNSEENNNMYPQSSLCLDLNDTTGKDTTWSNNYGATFVNIKSPCYQLIQLLGNNGIKKVTKQVAIKETSNFEVKEYPCYLFPLTFKEILEDLPSAITALSEGTTYLYWWDKGGDDHNKSDLNGNPATLYSVSPDTSTDNRAWYFESGDGFSRIETTTQYCVSFAFCI